MPGHDHAAMAGHQTSGDASMLLMQQASGTSTNPAAAPMHMSMLHYRGWMLMDHASLFAGQIVQLLHIFSLDVARGHYFQNGRALVS